MSRNNESKLLDYSIKLANIASSGDLIEVMKLLLKVSKKCSQDPQQDILKLVTKLLELVPEANKPLDLMEEYVQELIKSSSITEYDFSNYLVVLNKTGNSLKLLEKAEDMAQLFPSSSTALSWICKVYNELYIEENTEFNCDKICTYVDKLLEFDPQNTMGLFTHALLEFKDGKSVIAREKLLDVTSQRPGLVYAWILLTDVQLKLNLVQEAVGNLNKAQRLTKSFHDPGKILRKLRLQEVEILSLSDDREDWRKCLEIFSHKEDNTLLLLPHIITACIKLNNFIEAETYISELESKNKNIALLYKLKLYRKQGKVADAQKLIEESSYDSLWWWLEVGEVYWDSQEYSKALEPFLKAAKCDPGNYIPFVKLGHYYIKVSQFEKARRCYEKAFKLNSLSSEAGSALSKIYRKQKNWDANLSLLVNFTQGFPDTTNVWAWLQLGLTYLEQANANSALEYLRIVIRIQPENVHCWESLADAYFSNGAYTSALKCYQKALNLAQTSLYSALQVAYVKKILGEYAEAQVDFENILVNNRSYVPALKGLGETYLCRAKECYKDQRIGTARDYAQKAANKLTLAVFQRSELTCLWKLLANSVHLVANLPEKYFFMKISRSFIDATKSDESVLLEQEELFEMAIKFYCKAISLAQDNPFFWHDLSTCYLDYARSIKSSDARSRYFNNALSTAQQCTLLNPGFWQHWNLLGNVALFIDPPNYALAQHSFIKAVIAENNSSIAWTNLGTLYLLMGDLKLANKAFSEGQRSDPNYMNCWIGQAIIAETMGHSDAMDLFRHSTQLGQHQQGSIGFGHWVCQILLNSSPDDKAVKYNIYNMHAIPIALDAINWYIEKNQDNSCAWNILGILSERMGLLKTAKNAFKHAFVLADKKNKDFARVNYGRLLYRMGEYESAIEMFANVEAATFSSGGGLALALFRNAQYQESYGSYEQALHWLTEEQASQSELLVALASMAYKFQGPDGAKTILFQSIGLNEPSPWSLYATFSLSLLHNDMNLCQLVLKDLVNLEAQIAQKPGDHSEFIFHYATLLSCLYLLMKDKKAALCELSRLIHNYPNVSSTWLILSQFLLRLESNHHKLKAGTKCANAALKLGNSNTDVTTALCTVALSFQRAGHLKEAAICAQKLVHYNPDLADGWAILIPLLLKSKSVSSIFLSQLRNYLCKIKCSENILKWCCDLTM
ncbi:tetratricopeptide repeat protein 37 isoform X2 [Euwallacea fornicatus]|uniref:tetratricopeptide repeat protein 37 isoform X2 n=1 Tax=Euwallacea fornicatus TaxID=995702 RepID=UPI00338D80D4